MKESEAAARTVDILRILLAYALDPIVIDGKVKPQDIEIIEVSVRNLLHELTELSETTRAPDLPEPVVNVPQPKKKSFTSVKDVEMKRGDWICSQYVNLKFSF